MNNNSDGRITKYQLSQSLIDELLNTSSGSNVNNFKKIIRSSEWVSDSQGMVEAAIQHNLFQNIVSIMVYTVDTKKAIDFSYTIIDNTSIKITIQEAADMQVILVGTMKPQDNNNESSILDFCIADENNEIINQDESVAAWIASGLNLYGPKVRVYLKKPITFPKFCKLSGSIEFFVDEEFIGDNLITVNQGVIFEDVVIINEHKPGITLISGVENKAHDVLFRNITINDRIGCKGIYFKKADYLRVVESQFLHHENTSGIAKEYRSITLTDSSNAIIANNTFRSYFGDSTNKYNGIVIEAIDGTWSLTIDGNNFSADKVNDSKFIVLGASSRRVVISNNNATGPIGGGGIDFIVTTNDVSRGDLYGLNITGNSTELGAGYFLYCHNTNILQSVVSNNISINSTNGMSVFGYHSIFKGNSIHGTWWGQEGSDILAVDNLNATISGNWHSSSTGNITTVS